MAIMLDNFARPRTICSEMIIFFTALLLIHSSQVNKLVFYLFLTLGSL